MAKKVLISGGTGLVGSKVAKLLQQSGYEVALLTRDSSKSSHYTLYEWDIQEGHIDPQALDNTHAVIHLAGAGIAEEKWSPTRKKIIKESRTQSTQLLYQSIKTHQETPEVVLCASASGYYGNSESSHAYQEEEGPGNDFLAEVTKAWEAEQQKFSDLGIRLLQFRIGVVLSRKGGALPQMAQPIKNFVGAPLGSGKQYLSWIHIEDLARLFLYGIEHSPMEGVYNAAAPEPQTNEAFTKELAKVLHRPVLPLHVPAFVLRMALGEMADVVLLGNKMSTARVESSDFAYQYPHLKTALKDLYNKE